MGNRCIMNPLQIICLLKNAKRIRLHSNPRSRPTTRHFCVFEQPGNIQLPALCNLELIFPQKSIRFEDFINLFKLFPNLQTMTCNFYGITNFDEDYFVAFVIGHKNCFSNLKIVKMSFKSAVIGMSFKSVAALIKNSDIEFFENLFSIHSMESHFEDLASAVEERNLVMIRAVQTSSVESRWVSVIKCHMLMI